MQHRAGPRMLKDDQAEQQSDRPEQKGSLVQQVRLLVKKATHDR